VSPPLHTVLTQLSMAMQQVAGELNAPAGYVAVVDARSMRVINRRHGRGGGDRVLAAMGRSLRRHLEGSVARLPGDQYVVVRSGSHDLAAVRDEIERATHVWVVARPWRLLRASGSVGIATWHDDQSRGDVIRRAALHRE
jgi:GGDEF domain-containing protein